MEFALDIPHGRTLETQLAWLRERAAQMEDETDRAYLERLAEDGAIILLTREEGSDRRRYHAAVAEGQERKALVVVHDPPAPDPEEKVLRIPRERARDTRYYREAKAKAERSGATLVLADD